MIKKLSILAILLAVFSGCESVITSTTPYEDVVSKAYDTDLSKNNKNGNGYTFRAPTNAQVKKGSKFISSIEIANNTYSVYVNTTKYLEDKNLVVQTVNGEYILATNTNAPRTDNTIFEYRKILLADDPNLSIDENQNNARKVMQELQDTGNPAENFAEFAINYSSDTATSSNGGFIGPVNSSEIDNKTLAVLKKLDEKNVHSQLIAVESGYEILMLEKRYTENDDSIVYEDVGNSEYIFSTDDREFQTVVIDNKNDTYSVLTRNNHITVSANVTEKDIKQAMYTTIVTARSININEDVVLYALTNPSASTKSAEIFNLNSTTESSDSTISSQYRQVFSSALSSEDNEVNTNSFSFNSRPLTDEEISSLNSDIETGEKPEE